MGWGQISQAFPLGAAVFFVLGAARLLLLDSVSLPGVPDSCGNPLAYLLGSDHTSGLGFSACRAPLRNGAVEGVALILIAVLFGILAFVLFVSAAVKERRANTDPGDISW